ncbi:MAG: hypothetical protein ACTS68_01890 [Candidatus Hodgkinia cicadicola]
MSERKDESELGLSFLQFRWNPFGRWNGSSASVLPFVCFAFVQKINLTTPDCIEQSGTVT